VIYGGRGEDHLIGGADNDYLDGGRGDDIVSGRGGDDIVAGGDGDDDVFGGAGDDTLIAGRGEDTIYDNHAGDRDRVFAQAEDDVSIDDGNATNVEIFEVYDPDTSQIRTSGTLEERDRIQSDLDTLASIPEGAAVLESIDTNTGGHTVTIGIDATDGSSASPASSAGTYEFGGVNGNDSDGTPNADVGQDGTVSYNPTTTRLYDSKPDEDWHDTPPVVILHHELLHTEDYVHGARDPGLSQQVEHDGNGNPVPSGPGAAPPAVMTYPPVVQPDGTVVADPIPPRNNRELSVVGLPFDEDDRLNSEPAAPATEVDPNTRQHTENSLRDQLGLPRRRYY
ncbi:MAG: M91 family zinc metallopeptidase, partial [Actinomycetota bacterium]